jgi:hypothetical protein
MRKVSVVIGLCAIVAVALNLTAQAPRTELKPIMLDIQAGNTALGAAITANNASDAAIQAAKLEAHFTEASAIFTKEGVPNATKMAKEIADAAGDFAKAARAGDMSGAGKAKTAIAKCKGCHDLHREGPLPDKSYKLKK